MLKKLSLVILVFFVFDSSSLLANINEFHEIVPEKKYIRVIGALRDIMPDDIIKVILGFSYQHKQMSRILGMPLRPYAAHDMEFFKSTFPYVKNTIIINDKNEINTNEIIPKISSAIAGKKVVLLFYSGHGEKDGAISLGSYTSTCKNLSSSLLAKHPTFLHYIESKQTEAFAPYEASWNSGHCQKRNYQFTPQRLFGSSLFSGKKVIFINSSCYSGTYNSYLGNPLKMLIYSAQANEVGISIFSPDNDRRENIIVSGGFLITNMKIRLLPQHGCKLDGRGNSNKRDLVLNVSEWTYEMHDTFEHTLDYKGTETNSTTTGVGISPTIDQQVLSIPVQVYTGKQCYPHQEASTLEWKNINQQAKRFKTTLSAKESQELKDISHLFNQMAKGEYVDPDANTNL